ncbi:hypothetical protein EYF80_045319 [Liparis tanakae]|uniref:Uncharacterized protein n=1 Tax=Liparis tanakae TaxID=230148 RepID=A0A4Z2FTA8_9TELE|nr:hypothetical protein EYF80_045319 [Liparis tanakae]
MAHSRARTLMRLLFFSSAYSAPIRAPMEVPPTMSTGMPASLSLSVRWRVISPGAPSPEHQGDAVAGEDPGQAGEVRMAVGTLIKHALVQLPLEEERRVRTAGQNRGSEPREQSGPVKPAVRTSLGKLLREKTLRGQDRWWCLEIQLLMFSHSAVPLGGAPSSLWSNTSCFWERTAPPSSIRSI